MAVIGKIRSYSKLLIAIVGIALVAFVLGDFIKKGNRDGAKDFAEISGEKVSFNDFEVKVDQQLNNWKRQTGSETPTQEIMYQIREQVWNQMLREILMSKEYEKLGLSVSPEELKNLCTGENPHPYIVQSFTNPQTGVFDREQVLNFVNQFDNVDEATQSQWLELEKAIKDERINSKYIGLIKAGIYVTKNQSKNDYIAKNKTANLRLVYANFNLVDDKEVVLTDKDYQNYIDNHKKELEIEEPIREVNYVVFNVVPSSADQKAVENDINKIKEEFTKADNPESFVNMNSEEPYDSTFYKKGTLSFVIDSIMFNAPVGTIYGPYIENNAYKVAKLIDVQTRPDSIKASHILITYQGAYRSEATRTKEQAKALADSILNVVNKDAKKFKDVANTFTEDPSGKTKGGELPTFTDGAMVGPFNEACIKNKVGSNVVVETVFGYHIVNVIDKKNPVKKAKVAIITKKMDPSNETFQNTYALANKVVAECKDNETFEKYVADNSLNMRTAKNLRIMDVSLPGLENTREIIHWSFDEASTKGSMKLFETDGKYIVAIVKSIINKGVPTVDLIKTDIERFVKIEKKAEILMNKFKDAGDNLESIAKKMNLKVDSINGISFASINLPGIGPEPAVVGTVFGLNAKTTSKPIKGNSGIFVVTVDNVTDAPEAKDLSMNKTQMQSFYISRASYEVFTEIQKSSKITDNRGYFYK